MDIIKRWHDEDNFIVKNSDNRIHKQIIKKYSLTKVP